MWDFSEKISRKLGKGAKSREKHGKQQLIESILMWTVTVGQSHSPD